MELEVQVLSSAYSLLTRDALQSRDLGCRRVSVFLKAPAATLPLAVAPPAEPLEILWFMGLCRSHLRLGNDLYAQFQLSNIFALPGRAGG